MQAALYNKSMNRPLRVVFTIRPKVPSGLFLVRQGRFSKRWASGEESGRRERFVLCSNQGCSFELTEPRLPKIFYFKPASLFIL